MRKDRYAFLVAQQRFTAESACFGLIFSSPAVSLTLVYSNRVTLNFFWVTLSCKGLTKIAYECSASSSPRTSFDCQIVRKRRLKRKRVTQVWTFNWLLLVHAPNQSARKMRAEHNQTATSRQEGIRISGSPDGLYCPPARSIRSAKATQRRKFARPAMS